ncbi:MAG: class I SAM-dependent methyltransferase [Bacteroidota bacterium]
MQTEIVSTSSHQASDVARAFDGVAGVFDRDLENSITAELRRRVYSILTSLVPSGSTILDINCGTGIDALFLAESGYRVTCMDVSSAMIAEAKKKFSLRSDLQTEFTTGSFDDLADKHVPPVDMILSNFGGINCSGDLERTAQAIASAIKPGGFFVGVIMPRFSLWESSSYLLHFQWRKAKRRFGGIAAATGFGNQLFPVYYYSPDDVLEAFGDGFIKKRIAGLSIVAPTPQSTGFAQRHPGFVRLLFRLDRFLQSVPVLRSIGDHFIIVLQKQ